MPVYQQAAPPSEQAATLLARVETLAHRLAELSTGYQRIHDVIFEPAPANPSEAPKAGSNSLSGLLLLCEKQSLCLREILGEFERKL